MRIDTARKALREAGLDGAHISVERKWSYGHREAFRVYEVNIVDCVGFNLACESLPTRGKAIALAVREAIDYARRTGRKVA